MYKEGFNLRLKNARILCGYTQKEVASKVGLAQSQITRYENGQQEPSIEILGILIDMYGASARQIIGTER